MIVVNPLGGGGLSNAKLALADAVAANVLAGKKFYAADKALKTGTLIPTEAYCYSFTLGGYETKTVGVGAEPNLYVFGWATVTTSNYTVFCASSPFYSASTAERGLEVSVSRSGANLCFINNNSSRAGVYIYVFKHVPMLLSGNA